MSDTEQDKGVCHISRQTKKEDHPLALVLTLNLLIVALSPKEMATSHCRQLRALHHLMCTALTLYICCSHLMHVQYDLKYDVILYLV